MLIISRRQAERVNLGRGITLTIVKVSGEKVRIGVEAPADTKVLRGELDADASVLPIRGQAGSDIAKFRRAA